MLEGGSNGGHLERSEVIANLKVMLIAVKEPGHLLALVLRALLLHPDQAAEVVNNPQLDKAAVDETMRWSPLVSIITRQATRPVCIAGVELPAGALIAAMIGSANLDEGRWTHPKQFDIHRAEGMHLGFGAGTHKCLGAWLARTITRVGVSVALSRLTNLRIGQDLPAVELEGWSTRKVTRLKVQWDA